MTSRNPVGETEQFLHKQIPLSRAMGVRVESNDGKQFVLTAPLSLNHNHLGTAFGGSLSAIVMLAGYGLLWLELGDRECHIVISKSSISFRRPVHGIIRAVCHRPESRILAQFKKKFAQKGKAQIRLVVTIGEEGHTAVDFEGIYVAKK